MSDQTTDKKNGPADTLRDGAVKATIWERESDKGAFFATTLSRTYSDAEGCPQDSQSFAGTDLLKVSELAKRAYTRSQELGREEPGRTENDERDDRKARFLTSRARRHVRSIQR